ncbi:MAG: hypothetical protein RL375_860 [Pseudomonadota bacterium]|jgi:hypothetical protein
MAINSDFRSRVAEASVPAYSVVKTGTAAGSCIVGATATDKVLGTSDELDHVAGEMVDIAVGPVPKVRLGGTVAVGDALTSNATGAAIVTTTIGHRYIGFAEQAGVSGDVITYFRSLGVF